MEALMDDKTKVPVGWLFAIIGALLTAFCFAGGVIVWAAHVEDKVNVGAERVVRLEATQSSYGSDQQEIKETLARIEGYLKRGRYSQ